MGALSLDDGRNAGVPIRAGVKDLNTGIDQETGYAERVALATFNEIVHH